MGVPNAPQPAPVCPYRSPWFIFRFLCLVAAICAFISALCFAGIANGPAMAWLAGAVSAYFLAWAVP